MRTLGLGMMITGAILVWVSLGKARSGSVDDERPGGETAGGSGFSPESGFSDGGSSGTSGVGSW